MNKISTMPLKDVSADVCVVPKWLLTRLQDAGRPIEVLADSKVSANILSDEEIIYYLNGMECVLSLNVLMTLFSEGLDVWYVAKGNYVPPSAIFKLLEATARLNRTEVTKRYRQEFPKDFGHIVMGYYLRGPDSDVDLTEPWHVEFDAINVGRDIYITWEVKSGASLPHTDDLFCKDILKALEPFTDRNALRHTDFYARLATKKKSHSAFI